MSIEILNEDTFKEATENGRVLVKFGAEWCAPCKAMEPALKEAAEEMTDVTFAEISIDDAPELAGQFGIRSVPTLILFEEGEVVKTSPGSKTKSGILDML